MKAVVYHLTGNANVKAALKGMQQADLLQEFHVTIASFKGDWVDKLGALGPLAEIRRRRFEPELKPHVRTWPWLEFGRLVTPRIGLRRLSAKPASPFFVDAVVQKQDRRVAARLKKAAALGAGAVYGYEDCCIHSFAEAKRLSLRCFYDLPIGYWRAAQKLLRAESNRWPDWSATLETFRESDDKLRRKEEELRMADRIFVASSFTAQTLREFPGTLAPVSVIPYGFPATDAVASNRSYYNGQRPLKLLFVGSLSQRKGLADVFAVADKLKPHVSLTVVGNKTNVGCPALSAALAKHRWIPSLSHSDILTLMQEHDVLVFPSLFEGFGLVITEAMSRGTPVITTNRTAGPDLITHGGNGWLIEAGSTEALQTSIEEILLQPEIVAAAGKAALQTAQGRPWSKYGEELAGAVREGFETPVNALVS